MDSLSHPEPSKKNRIGFLGAVTLGIVMLSPAMTLYGCFGPSYLQAGKAVPLAFLLALIATLPTATSYALLAREHPDSGSAASWITMAVPKKMTKVVGIWTGWMVFFYYFFNFIIQPITAGVFLNDWLTSWGYHPNFLSYAMGVIVCCAWPALSVYRGISKSSKGALNFLIFESAVVIALCATVLWLSPSHIPGTHFSLDGFKLSSSPDGASGLFRGLIFALLAFCGFDVISTLSEETKMSKRMIPQATFAALLIFGVVIIAGVWAFSYASTLVQVKAVTDAGGMPISDIAHDFWGKYSFLIPVTAISAALGITIATAVGSSRILLSMSKKGFAPLAFAKLHDKYQTPWSALNFIFILGFFAAIFTGAALGPFFAYNWWGTTSVFFAMVTYLMVNVANLVLFRKIIFKSGSNFFLHAFIPILGIGIDSYILLRSFFIELWTQGWENGQSVVVFDVALAGVVLVWATIKSVRRS
jgi:putrescine importer